MLNSENKLYTIKYIIITILLFCIFLVAGCGEADSTSSQTSKETVTGASITISTPEEITNYQNQHTTSVSTKPNEPGSSNQHRHYYIYTSNCDGTHTVTCSDADCNYQETEDCTFTDNNNCARCDYIHTHNYSIYYMGNNTHKYVCNTSWCKHEYTEKCELNYLGVCKKCSTEHVHEFEIKELTTGNFYEVCKNTTCTVQNFLWSDESIYFIINNKRVNLEPTEFYIMQTVNLLSEPNKATATVKGKIQKDEKVKITGQVLKYRNSSVLYYKTSDGYYFADDTAKGILRLAKSTETVVHKASDTTQGIYWYNPSTFYKSYESVEAAVLDISGKEIDEIKSKGTGRTDSNFNFYYDYDTISLMQDNSFLSCEKGVFYID